jgi:hypothetical protein
MVASLRQNRIRKLFRKLDTVLLFYADFMKLLRKMPDASVYFVETSPD